MIVASFNSVAYRVHQPKWSFAPTSGAGAGTYGGRANRPGVNALYLSLELETALSEYQQLDALLPPGLMVSYNVSVDAIVDFRGGYTSDCDPIWTFIATGGTCISTKASNLPPGSSVAKSWMRAPKASCSTRRSPAALTWSFTLMRSLD